MGRGGGAGGRDFMEARDRGDIETVERMRKAAHDFSWTIHFGQVVTLEDVHRILEFMYPIGLMTCACRRSMRGLPADETFTCIGVGPGMYKWERWPDTYRGGVEFMAPAEAKKWADIADEAGLVHTAD